MVTGNVFVKPGGFLHLHGTASGDVMNNGGKIKVYGTLVGQLHDIAGETYIDRNAAIHIGVV